LADAKRYRNGLRDPQASQNDVLFEILRTNQSTAFGKEHGFSSIRTIDEYRSSVPLSRYEDYAERIERMKRGEHNLLIHEPTRCIVPTGGSTGGAKHIPHPARLLRSFQRAIAPWMADLNHQYPDIRNGSAYWAITPSVQNQDFPDDTFYLGQKLARIVAHTLAVPSAVARHQHETFWTVTLQCLLKRADLSLVSVWHPSFFNVLLDQLAEQWESLLPTLPERRYRELRKMDPGHIAGIWPRLRVVSCWGDGHAASASHALGRRLTGIDIQPKGLIATEAFVSLPFAQKHPLAVCSHFFEFIDRHGRIYLASELTQGSAYHVVVTTSGGFYRYQLQDEIIVDGYVHATPSVRFRGKLDATSDLVGEKLTEAFVSDCLIGEYAKLNMEPVFSMLAPNETRSGYLLFIESNHVSDSLAQNLHHALMKNPQYSYAATMRQLAPVQIVRIPRDGYLLYTRRLQSKGRRLGDIKAVSLSKELHWSHWFKYQQEPSTGTDGCAEPSR